MQRAACLFLLASTLIASVLPVQVRGQGAGPDPVDLDALSSRALVELHVDIGEALRDRGVVRSGNGLTGELAEHIFLTAFGWDRARASQAGYDASAEGLRYQIKARRMSLSGGSRQMGAIRDLEGFDVLAVILFDRRYRVARAALIPAEVVAARADYVAHTNSWRFMFEDSVLAEPGVTDVTGVLSGLDY